MKGNYKHPLSIMNIDINACPTFCIRAALPGTPLSREFLTVKFCSSLSKVPGDANHCAVSLSTSSSVSTTAEPGVALIGSILLDELPIQDNGGLEAELDEEVSSGTEDEDDGIAFGDGARSAGSGDAVLATLEFVSGGTVSTEPALETAADDGRESDIAR